MTTRLSLPIPLSQPWRGSADLRVSSVYLPATRWISLSAIAAQFIEEMPESTMENVEIHTKGYYNRFQPLEPSQ